MTALRRLCDAQTAACRKLLSRIGRRLRDMHRDRNGAVAVVVALLFPVIIGGFGLGAETGYHYQLQRKLQHAADVASHAAGVSLRAGDTPAEIEGAALHIATEAGFDPAMGTLSVHSPAELNAEFHHAPDTVEVIITRKQPRFFSSFFIHAPVEMAAMAVARIGDEGSVACVLALSPSASRAVKATGSTSINLDGCDVASNSNAADAVHIWGNASLAAGCVSTVGQAETKREPSLSNCDAIREHAPVIRDPYASVLEPGLFGGCSSEKSIGHNKKTLTVEPTDRHPSGVMSKRFCNGLHIKGDVTFLPGLYIISGGDLSVTGGKSTFAGTGVTFFLAQDAALDIGGNATLDLQAPTSGAFSGILFFGSRDEGAKSHSISGTSGSTADGAIYTPASQVTFTGNSKANGCTQIIAREVEFKGNSSLESNCESTGTRDIETNEIVRIVG